uniref:Uncharacterized protein n=1 Tax=Acidianus brierleyi TaxID=41673 RepID=A0A2U9IBD0_9CREN
MVIVIILLVIAMFSTIYATKFTIKSGKFYPPYAKVIGAFTSNGKINVEIKIENESFPIKIEGGYVSILNTHQKENISPTNLTIFNVSFPITRDLASFSTVSVNGVIQGIMKGNKVFITFSSVAILHISISVTIINFTYNNYTEDIYLKIFNPINITIFGIKYPSISNANLSQSVVGGYYFPLNITLPIGVHYLNISLNFKKYPNSLIYDRNLSIGYYYYFSGYLLTRLYFIPPQNDTFYLYHIEEFSPIR